LITVTSDNQALDRTAQCQPVLPATPARMTHDYVRIRTTSLFAALDMATSSVIARHCRRHRHREFLRFLKLIDDAVPGGLDLHLLCGDYATHKTPAIHERLLRQQRFHLRFTSASSSWLNVAERWFAELTDRNCAGQRTAASPSSKPASVTESSNGTGTRNHSRGPGPPMRYPGTSQPAAAGLTAQQARPTPGTRSLPG
jgi:DDE superfamily endonuclease